jgi:hypothetical protein
MNKSGSQVMVVVNYFADYAVVVTKFFPRALRTVVFANRWQCMRVTNLRSAPASSRALIDNCRVPDL